MKRGMAAVAIAVAGAVAMLARCASGGVMTVGDGVVSDSVLEMLFCRPVTDCDATKDTTSSGAGARTRSSGTSRDKEAA
jgi:hypothetical protein